MPTITVKPGLTYFYTDNGAPRTSNYKTIIIFHGHTFHSGAFQRMNPFATDKDLRLICINHREYPGSTPFTQEELRLLTKGSEVERAAMITELGADYALFVDGIINACGLTNEGGVTLAGWSLGSVILLSLLTSITSLPPGSRERLKANVTGVVLWDPPSQAIGIKSPEQGYSPLWDEELPPEARGSAFSIWCAGYYSHGDISSRDPNQLSYREPGKSKTPSTLAMSPEDLGSITYFAPGGKWEDAVCTPYNFELLKRQTKKALFDPTIKAAWNGIPVWHLYGDSSPWNIIYASWAFCDLQKEAKLTEHRIHFKKAEGANHFFMWDEPERALEYLLQCVKI